MGQTVLQGGLIRRSLLLSTLCLFLACEGAETADQVQANTQAEEDSARAEITARMERFPTWFVAGQIDSLATLVTDDYVALAPNAPQVAGKAQWLESNRKAFALGRYTQSLTSESIEVTGHVAVQRGRFTVLFEPAATARGARAVSDTGKFLWHWRKTDSQWLLAAAAWNSDLPIKP